MQLFFQNYFPWLIKETSHLKLLSIRHCLYVVLNLLANLNWSQGYFVHQNCQIILEWSNRLVILVVGEKLNMICSVRMFKHAFCFSVLFLIAKNPFLLVLTGVLNSSKTQVSFSVLLIGKWFGLEWNLQVSLSYCIF